MHFSDDEERLQRFKRHAFFVLRSLGIVGTLFALSSTGVSAQKIHYDSNHVRWRQAESCAFSFLATGWPDIAAGSGIVIDIREIIDPHANNRVIGIIYVSNHGKKDYQVNPLFPFWDRLRLGLFENQGLWSLWYSYDPNKIGYPERECQPQHLTSNMTSVLYKDEVSSRIYRSGGDSIPSGAFSANRLHTPFLDEEKIDGKW